MAARTMLVGPYLLVRPLRTPNLRIYEVYNPAPDDAEPRLAVLWSVEAEEYGIPTEVRIRCSECPERPSPSRAESVSKAFYNREKALDWLRRHRLARHPIEFPTNLEGK